MKIKYNIGMSVMGLLCLCFLGCTQSEDIEEKNDGFSFILAPPLSLEIIDTKAPITLGEIAVKNVWIIQFAESEPESNPQPCIKGVYVPEEDITQTSEKNDLLIQLNTDKAGFSDVASSFYIIVNGGESLFTQEEVGKDNTSGTLTEDDLKSKTKSFTFPSDASDGGSKLQTTQPTLLSSGPIKYTPVVDSKILVVSRMYRAFSKISTTVNFKGKGAFSSPTIKVGNIPNKMALFEAGGITDSPYYPSDSDSDSDIDKKERTYPATSWEDNTTGEMIFYMPENLRGAGSGKVQQDKGVVTNGPKGTLDNCTYLTVEGTYKYDTSHTGGITVKYRFYLGGNFIDDYNIYRDYWYKLTINITGANSADLRVTITNGNVAVFDEVKTITNTVDF